MKSIGGRLGRQDKAKGGGEVGGWEESLGLDHE